MHEIDKAERLAMKKEVQQWKRIMEKRTMNKKVFCILVTFAFFAVCWTAAWAADIMRWKPRTPAGGAGIGDPDFFFRQAQTVEYGPGSIFSAPSTYVNESDLGMYLAGTGYWESRSDQLPAPAQADAAVEAILEAELGGAGSDTADLDLLIEDLQQETDLQVFALEDLVNDSADDVADLASFFSDDDLDDD